MSGPNYKKRQGTSAIRGHLHKSKLISLIFLRAKYNAEVEDFLLASNMDEVGAFGDICIRLKLKVFDRPVAVFLQAKYRENNKSVLTLNSRNDLAQCFRSYLNIRRAFKPGIKGFFEGNFDDTECVFVMYTTAKHDGYSNRVFISPISYLLNDLISTGEDNQQPCYKNQDVEFLCKIVLREQLAMLAELMGKFLCEDDNGVMPMNDDLMLRFHVILRLYVVDVSDIKLRNEANEHRIASFRPNFFENNDIFVKLFRDRLFTEIIKKQKLEEDEMCYYLTSFLENTSNIQYLSKLIGTVVIYEDGKLKFVNKMEENLKEELLKVNIFQSSVDQAVALAMKDMLASIQFKVPAAFGNKDLTIEGENEISKMLQFEHLTEKITKLLNTTYTVTINESLADGIFKLCGGIGGLVGNLLVHDEDTKQLKFTDNYESLAELSRRLFGKLKSQHENLHQYRFDVKVKNFPILTFGSSYHERMLVTDFLNNLVSFTSQANETGVGDILKGDIEDNISRSVTNCRVTSDALYVTYHDSIQKWWMEEIGTCLTKHSQIYELAANNIVDKPFMTVISLMYQLKRRNNIECTFKRNFIDSLKLPPGTVVVTEIIDLTVAKIIQYSKCKDHAVIDLEYMLNLQASEYNTLCDELKDTNKETILVILCKDKPSNRNWSSRLKHIAKVVSDKYIVIVTQKILVDFMREQFAQVNNIVYDPKSNLTDLTEETQESILQNAKVIFQGEEISLDMILDDVSKKYLEGDVFHKVISNESIIVGKFVGSLNYDKVKQLYVDRHALHPRQRNPILLMSLYDLEDEVILVTGRSGMGKSTLLTHLSHRAKKYDLRVWIVRVNLLDHCEVFSKWQKDKTCIDLLESLTFLCRAILSEKSGHEFMSIVLKLSNDAVYLEHCTGDESAIFEIKVFLHFYNSRNLMFLFDGFDEICPHYMREVLTLLNIVKGFPKRHRIWVASVSNDELKPILETQFGAAFEIQMFSRPEQNKYLFLYWKSRLSTTELSYKDLNKIRRVVNFIEYGLQKYRTSKEYLKLKEHRYSDELIRHAFVFFDYLKKVINKCPVPVNSSVVITIINDLILFLIHYVKDFYTPFHLYLVSDYVLNQIREVDNISNKMKFEINSEFTIYERFVETSLRRISFDITTKKLYNFSNIVEKNMRHEFFLTHRQLGTYAVFQEDLESVLSMKDLRAIVNSTAKIKEGKEKTGVISGVRDDVPIFLHMTFAECFAVRHICHVLKTYKEKEEKQKSIWDFIINVVLIQCSRNVHNILSYKIQEDDALKIIIKKNEPIILDSLLDYGRRIFSNLQSNDCRELYLKVKEDLHIATSHDLSEFVDVLYSITIDLKAQLQKLEL